MKLKRLYYTKTYRILLNGLWRDHPVSCKLLGMCLTLGVSNKVSNALAIGLGFTFVLVVTAAIISMLRNYIPRNARVIIYMVIISSFVIVVDRFLMAFYPSVSETLGPYIGLIITSCILVGRLEEFSIKNPVYFSMLDAFASGIGFAYTLIILAVIREFLGFGTILDIKVTPENWTNCLVIGMAPGAFFVLSIYLWIVRTLAKVDPGKIGVLHG
ncbi:MAG: Rnf-Nqr domain containing protein [Elusimicrobia bacterium]|nr:Rnf-Nqr domain containing protein [Elusimicrobiota bacterium]